MMNWGIRIGVLTSVCWMALSAPALAAISFYENASGVPLVQFIQSARSSVDIEIYDMNDPQVIQAIFSAQARNVKVRIIQEPSPAGSSCRIFSETLATDTPDCAQTKKVIAQVKANGGIYQPFPKVLCGTPNTGCFEHGKMVIVDRKQAFISTGNFNPTNLCNIAANPKKCNRDYSVIVNDAPILRTVLSIFESDLAGKPYSIPAILTQNGTQYAMTISPFAMDPLVQFVNSAKKRIVVQTQYLKDANFNAALIAAAKRGVEVFVNVASACSFGPPSATDQSTWKRIYSEFDAAGIKTRIFTSAMKVNGLPGYLHSKAIYVDGTTAWIGSVNGSTTSLTNNREFGIFTQDKTVVSNLYAHLTQDLNHPQSESWQESLVCKNDHVPLIPEPATNSIYAL